MRVVMNGLAALKPKTGVGHYVSRLSSALEDTVTLYPGEFAAGLVRRFQQRLPSSTERKPNRWPRLPKAEAAQLLKHLAKTAVGLHFAKHCQSRQYDLYHEPNFIPFSTQLPTIVTVHDLSVLLHPQWHPADRVKHHQRHFLPAVRRAIHLIAVSEHVRHELIEYLGIDSDKITAIPNGVGEEFQPLPMPTIRSVQQRLNLPERYFLSVGTIEPRKNLLTILKAFADLPQDVKRMCPLVLAGPWGWKSEPEREFLARNSDGIIVLGYARADDLPALYAGSAALLYPSHYEGFGLPPVEALACGTSVLASQSCQAVREILGPFGVFLEALDVRAWRDAMVAMAKDKARKIDPSAVAHAKRYTWTRTAQLTKAVYRNVLGNLRVCPAPIQAPSQRAA